MEQNLFFPIYKQLEKELSELSYYISFDKKQLNVYSIKISDLLLRTVSEIENIAKELCKKENIKFYDKKRHIRKFVNFNEYVDKLEEKYLLSKKFVEFKLDNANQNIYDFKLTPFFKDKEIKGKSSKVFSWYFAYNKIKHDRVKYFKQANLNNLIHALAALFLLNIYYLDKVFYDISDYNTDTIIKQIQSFSDVFEIHFTIYISPEKEQLYAQIQNPNTFFDPISYFKIGRPYSTYIIYRDIEIKTASDAGADIMDKITSSLVKYDPKTNQYEKVYNNYQFTDHKTKCALVAKLNKNQE